MSSIDEKQERTLRRFYQANILPLAGRIELVRGFHSPNRDQDSYYLTRDWVPLTRKDFEIPLGESSEIAASLDAFWSGTCLKGLGNKIVKLSAKFQDVQQRSDVSPFIYEML